MSMPPPPPPRQGKGPGFYIAVALCVGCAGLLVLMAVMAAVLFPVFSQARHQAQEISCLSNLKQQGLALRMYTVDYDDVLPRTAVWMDKLAPYTRRDAVFHCPGLSRQGKGPYGYAYNAGLSGKSWGGIAAPESVRTLYDSTQLERSASDKMTSLPVPGRHGSGSHRGNNVGFGDGHVKLVAD